MISRRQITALPLSLRFMFALLLVSSTLQAAETRQSDVQPLSEIHHLVLEYIKNKAEHNPIQKIYEPEFSIRELSKSLQLKKCQNELQLNDRNPDDYLGRMTIGVSCTQPKWKVYIPAKVNGKTKVVVSTKALVKKSTIAAEDITEVLMPYRSAPRGSLKSAKTAINMRTKRSIGANKPLRIRDLQPAFLVFKRRQVNIVTYIGSVKVETRGVAQANAVKDEQVAVKNLSSGKLVHGIVIAPNTVYIP